MMSLHAGISASPYLSGFDNPLFTATALQLPTNYEPPISLTPSTQPIASHRSSSLAKPLSNSHPDRRQLRFRRDDDVILYPVPNLELHSAAASGNVGLVHYALTHGQPVNSVLHGVLPLHAACSGGSVSVVRMLIERGADVNAPRLPRRYSDGRKPNVPSVGAAGSTPLHFAAANGHAPIVQILLTCGAIPDKADKNGMTPEALAEINGHTDVIRVLRVWEHLKLQESQSAQSSNSASGNQDGSDMLALPSPSTSMTNIDEDTSSQRYGSLGSRKGKERALSFASNTSDASVAIRMKKSLEGIFKPRPSRSASFASSLQDFPSQPSVNRLSAMTGLETTTPDQLPSPIDLNSPISPSPLRGSHDAFPLNRSESEASVESAVTPEVSSSPTSATGHHSPSIHSIRSLAEPASQPIRLGPVPKRSNTTSSRRPSLPSIIEKATHPGAAFRAAIHRDKARSPELSPASSSSPSRSTSLFRGRVKSNETNGSLGRRGSNASRKHMSKHSLLHLFRRGQSPPSRSPSPPHRKEPTKIIAAEDIDDGIERLKRASIDLDMRERQLTPDDIPDGPAGLEGRPVPATAPAIKTKFFPEDPDAPPVPNLDLSLYPQFSHLAPLITPSSITPSNYVERSWPRSRAASEVITPSPLANEWQHDPEPGQGVRRARTEVIKTQQLTEPASESSNPTPHAPSPSSPLRPSATKPRSATMPSGDMAFPARVPPPSGTRMYGLSWRESGLRKMASSLFWNQNERARRESESEGDTDHEADVDGEGAHEEEVDDSDGDEFLDADPERGTPEDRSPSGFEGIATAGSVRSGASSVLDSISSQSHPETLENQRSGSETERGEDGTETATERGEETEMEPDTDGEMEEYHDALTEGLEIDEALPTPTEDKEDGPTTPTASRVIGGYIGTNAATEETTEVSTPTAAVDRQAALLPLSADSTVIPSPIESPTTPMLASSAAVGIPVEVSNEAVAHVEASGETVAPVEGSSETVDPIEESSETVPAEVSNEITAPVEVSDEVAAPIEASAEPDAPVEVSSDPALVEVSTDAAPAEVSSDPVAPVERPSDVPTTAEVSSETVDPVRVSSETVGPVKVSSEIIAPVGTPSEASEPVEASGEVTLAAVDAPAENVGNKTSAVEPVDSLPQPTAVEPKDESVPKPVILEKISPPRASGSRFVESFDKTVEVREPPKPSPPKSSRWGRRFRGPSVGAGAASKESIRINTTPTALQMSSIKSSDIAERSPVALAESKMLSPPPPPPSIASGIDSRSRGISVSSTASSAAYSYMQTVSTPATSLTPPSLLSIALGSGFPPVPEDEVAHPPVTRRTISSRAEAADLVKRAEDDVLQLAQLPPSLDSSRSLAAQLAAYGDSHALEQEFVEREKRQGRRVGSGSEFDSSDQGSFVSAQSDPSATSSALGSSARTGGSSLHPKRRTARQTSSLYSVEHPKTSVPSINTIYDKRAAAYRERMQALTSLPPVMPPGSPRSHPRPRAASSDAWLTAGSHHREQDVRSEADVDRYPNISSPMPFVSSDLIPPRPQKKHSLPLAGRSSASVAGSSLRMVNQHSNLSTASMARSLSPMSSMSTRLGAPSIRAGSYRHAPAPIADVVSARYQGMSPPTHAPYISIFSSRYAGTPHDGGDSDDEEQAPARLTVIENDWRGGHVVGGGPPADSLKKGGKWGNLKGAIGHLGGRK